MSWPYFVEPDLKQSMIAWASARGGNGHLFLLEIGIKNQIFLEKIEVGIFIPIFSFDSCNQRRRQGGLKGLKPLT